MCPQFIERLRLLPYHGQVDVNVGDLVTEAQSIAHLDYVPATMQRVNVAKDLVIDPAELGRSMLKRDGEFARRGEVLATSFLLGERICSVAPIDGYIGMVSRRLGHVYLRQPLPLGAGERMEIDVLQELGVSRLRGVLKVREGTRVMPGQAIAATIGVKPQVITSSLYGQVTSISGGKVVIEPLRVKTELRAYVRGSVTEVLPRQGAVIRAYAHLIQGQYGVGGENGGELLVTAEASEQLRAGQVEDAWRGKVVVVGRTADVSLLEAADEAGCAAIVVGHLHFETLKSFMGGIGTPGLTGNEERKMTVILTERFTPASMQETIWCRLNALNGRYASVNGTTHIRAGVIRPEIVVCEPALPDGDQQLAAPTTEDLKVGDVVRVVRQPWRDCHGLVLELPRERQQLVTGSKVQVAVVSINGQQVTVPVSNLVRVREDD